MLWRAKERCGVEYCFFISPRVLKLPQPHIFMSTGPALYEYPHQVLLLPTQDGSGPLGPQLHWPLYGDSEETYCYVVVYSREFLQQ